MHRDGSGNRIVDIEQARSEWAANGRTKTTYCSKREWDAWQEDLGVLSRQYDDGKQVRRNATVKFITRGGTYAIMHNCVLVGNPSKAPNMWTRFHNNRFDSLLLAD